MYALAVLLVVPFTPHSAAKTYVSLLVCVLIAIDTYFISRVLRLRKRAAVSGHKI